QVRELSAPGVGPIQLPLGAGVLRRPKSRIRSLPRARRRLAAERARLEPRSNRHHPRGASHMQIRSNLAKGALALAAGVASLTMAAAPSVASAQPYGGTYYDPCKRDQTNRGTAGALLGGALGAAIGSN